MPPFTVLRIQKLKTWGAIAGAAKHNQRERETPNADEDRRDANRQLIGTTEKDTISAARELIGGQRIRSNAVLGVELLLSASPEYFRPNAPERAGAHDVFRLDSWVKATTDWLQQRYGARVVSAASGREYAAHSCPDGAAGRPRQAQLPRPVRRHPAYAFTVAD